MAWWSIILLWCSLATCWQVFPDSAVDDYEKKCADALSTNITTCLKAVHGLSSNNHYSQHGLDVICKDECRGNLQKYEQTVKKACPGVTYTSEWGNDFPISAVASTLVFNFNQTCLKDEGKYCNLVLGNLTKNDGDQCHKCTLLKLRNEAQFPYGSGPKVYSEAYPSFTSSCGFTGYPVTAPPTSKPSPSTSKNSTSTSVSATPTSSACKGEKYTIKKGDTCESVSKSQSVATMQLLLDNELQAYCHNFPTKGDLCIMNQCAVYTVKDGDTCKSVAKAHNITTVQLRSYNPWIDGNCYNFNRAIGTQICMDEPGDKYRPPSRPVGIPTSVSSATTASTAAPTPTNVADKTTKQCGKYYAVKKGEDCGTMVKRFGISREDLGILNPGLNANCTNLLSDVSYCVTPVEDINNYPGAPGYVPSYSTIAWDTLPSATYKPVLKPHKLPLARGTSKDCQVYADGEDLQYDFGVTPCKAAEVIWEINEKQLLDWNPSLRSGGKDEGVGSGFKFIILREFHHV
ncbi:hypothetical protein P168DRAFT_315012 [Aspergillus campestris IBT 28561]|uniref:LysM domain-containing protein n=1 Tax=Aspergillus campestris (strain IBT 28561) TaxID=1392248 RepID=A0A2I1DGH2_ASPC2|nr:uncharacterized protein P168DRAFT_315012 [Aspergillus campestris IBT 28561]PKY08970.1 hypothetical protein P168DRAFT_315012 [Aspergillus campestris IBT 28561]